MSILIKGMEMPRHCGECAIEWCDRWKRLIIAGMPIAKERPSDCPIVPVPPHGRLIDADALMGVIATNIRKADDAENYEWWNTCTVAGDFVVDAPTIIPAEEGET